MFDLCLFKLRRGSIGNLLMVPQSFQNDCIWKKPQISVIIALFHFAIMKDLEAGGGAENMSRQSMDGISILIPSLILEKLRRNTCQYRQQ